MITVLIKLSVWLNNLIYFGPIINISLLLNLVEGLPYLFVLFDLFLMVLLVYLFGTITFNTPFRVQAMLALVLLSYIIFFYILSIGFFIQPLTLDVFSFSLMTIIRYLLLISIVVFALLFLILRKFGIVHNSLYNVYSFVSYLRNSYLRIHYFFLIQYPQILHLGVLVFFILISNSLSFMTLLENEDSTISNKETQISKDNVSTKGEILILTAKIIAFIAVAYIIYRRWKDGGQVPSEPTPPSSPVYEPSEVPITPILDPVVSGITQNQAIGFIETIQDHPLLSSTNGAIYPTLETLKIISNIASANGISLQSSESVNQLNYALASYYSAASQLSTELGPSGTQVSISSEWTTSVFNHLQINHFLEQKQRIGLTQEHIDNLHVKLAQTRTFYTDGLEKYRIEYAKKNP